jgi:subtilisin family serine protease
MVSLQAQVVAIAHECARSSYLDDQGHGTHVAGIAAGSVHGVARAATVHAVKVGSWWEGKGQHAC